ncbi:hypothetical protein KEM52_000196 [Ascosphaera acerosa]|nr:hypothetical protein KEM52_000196 [Ascosphaera acerosa]
MAEEYLQHASDGTGNGNGTSDSSYLHNNQNNHSNYHTASSTTASHTPSLTVGDSVISPGSANASLSYSGASYSGVYPGQTTQKGPDDDSNNGSGSGSGSGSDSGQQHHRFAPPPTTSGDFDLSLSLPAGTSASTATLLQTTALHAGARDGEGEGEGGTPASPSPRLQMPGSEATDFAFASVAAAAAAAAAPTSTSLTGASAAINEIAWTGHGSQWEVMQLDEPVGALPGVFEKDPQLELDFILTLESPCRTHMEFVNRRAADDPEQELYCGHALMASCPPPAVCEATPRGQPYAVETYDLPRASLAKLLNLSRQLVTEGQITPIMALQNLKCHAAYAQLTPHDVRLMINELATKIRCYGFGAVMEDFEFVDSLTAILNAKTEAGVGVAGAVGGRAADRYQQMFGQRLAALQGGSSATAVLPDGRMVGGGGVAGPGLPQVDEFLYA